MILYCTDVKNHQCKCVRNYMRDCLNAKSATLLVLLLAVGFGLAGCGTDAGTNANDDISVPAVTTTFPEDGDTGVWLDVVVLANFNQPMDPTSLDTSTFTLTRGTEVVQGTVNYADGTATFTPSEQLSPFVTYTATVSGGVRSATGELLGEGMDWSFTTGDTFEPQPG